MTAIAVNADTSQFRFGTQSLKCTTGNTGSNAVYPTRDITVVPGSQYTFSAYIKTNAAITGGYIALRLAPGSSLTQFAESTDHVTDSSGATLGWQRVILTATIPVGVFTVRPYVVYTGTTAGQVFWIDGIKHEAGSVASEWQQNFTAPQATHEPIGTMIDGSKGGVWRLIGTAGGARDTVQLGASGLQFAGDTDISSPTAGYLRSASPTATDAYIQAYAPSGQNAYFVATLVGDTSPRLQAGGSTPGLLFGPGNTAADTRLRRSAIYTLELDDNNGGATAAAVLSVLGDVSLTRYLRLGSSTPVSNEGYAVWDTTFRRLLIGDGTRAKPVTPVGWAPHAYPMGIDPNSAFTTSMNLPVSGGGLSACMVVPAPMFLTGYTIVNNDAASAHTLEARLYIDKTNGSSSADFVTGSDATFSYTPGAAGAQSSNGGTLNSTPIVIAPGVYWLVIRNTSASVAANIGGTSGVSGAISGTTDVGSLKSGLAALGSTIDLVTGWTRTRQPGVALRGKVLGQSASW